jgi:N-formylglutamate deformylase
MLVLPMKKIATNMVSDKQIYQLIQPKGEETIPILFESPHSGTFHPIDGAENISAGKIYPGVDRYIDQLFDFAPAIGAPLVYAEFCRCFIDTNRALSDMRPDWFSSPWPEPLFPTDKSNNGLGLVWPNTNGTQFSPDDISARIDEYYRPYHAIIQSELLRLKNIHGQAIHISCHSAPKSIMKPQINPRLNYTADIVISDQFGQTADAKIGKKLRKLLTAQGYNVLSNDPFQGDELIAANGAPHNHIHSIQIEINRALYMNEKTQKIEQSKFDALKRDLHSCFYKLSAAF